MQRREFIKGIGASSLLLSLFPNNLISAALKGPQPYQINLEDPKIEKQLKSHTLTNVIRINAIHENPKKRDWGIGEGKTNSVDSLFVQKQQIYNSKCSNSMYHISQTITPVVLLQTASYQVYGQFGKNPAGNFSFGIVKGFDGRFYVVHSLFRRVFAYKHHCYGLPISDYAFERCPKCKRLFVKQRFQSSDCDKEPKTLYGSLTCPAGGYHAGIPKISPLAPCGIQDDNLEIGAEY